MKKRIFNILIFNLFIGVLHAQQNADAIIGYYYMIDPFSKEGTQIYMSKSKDNNTYEAKVVWVSNPDKAKYIGLVFLTKLKYNIKKNAWEDAEVVYPGKKGTFSLDMKFDHSSKLKVRGYWGVSLLGMTMYWNKEEYMRK
jgi:uncharacterized protein (DUF2147 family)